MISRTSQRSGKISCFPARRSRPKTARSSSVNITDTRVAQPVLGIADLAMARLFDRVGVRPDMTAGHSFGELVALSVAGAIDQDALVSLAELRAECILDAACRAGETAATGGASGAARMTGAAGASGAAGSPGTMAAVKATAARVREILGDER